MTSNTPRTATVEGGVAPEMFGAIDRFQAQEKLSSRAEAVRLLLEIALDTVAESGDRFWDKRRSRSLVSARSIRFGKKLPGAATRPFTYDRRDPHAF